MAPLLSSLSNEDGQVQMQGASPLPYQNQLDGSLCLKGEIPPLRPHQMRPPPHFVQVYFETFFDLLD